MSSNNNKNNNISLYHFMYNLYYNCMSSTRVMIITLLQIVFRIINLLHRTTLRDDYPRYAYRYPGTRVANICIQMYDLWLVAMHTLWYRVPGYAYLQVACQSVVLNMQSVSFAFVTNRMARAHCVLTVCACVDGENGCST